MRVSFSVFPSIRIFRFQQQFCSALPKLSLYKYNCRLNIQMPSRNRKEVKTGQLKFDLNEVIWAKITGHPWWPATITQIPSRKKSNFRVDFFFDTSHAFVPENKLAKYNELRNADMITKTQNKNLWKAINLADNAWQEQDFDQFSSEEASAVVEPTSKRLIQSFQQQKAIHRELQENCIAFQSPKTQQILVSKDKVKDPYGELQNAFQNFNQKAEVLPQAIEVQHQSEEESMRSYIAPTYQISSSRQKRIERLLQKYNLNNIPKANSMKVKKITKENNNKTRFFQNKTRSIKKVGRKPKKQLTKSTKKTVKEPQIRKLLILKIFSFVKQSKSISIQFVKKISQSLCDQILQHNPFDSTHLMRLFKWIEITVEENILKFYDNWENLQQSVKQKASSMTTEEQ